MPRARIRLFGQFELRIDGTGLVQLGSAPVEALVAHLVLFRAAPQPRQRLAFLLWPDSTDAQARTNLRHVLHTLRQVLPDVDDLVEITPRTVRWRPEAVAWLDVAAYEQLVLAVEPDDVAVRRGALRDAVALYGGDLLEGRDVEWLVGERDRLRRRQLDALAELAGLCETQGDTAEAILHAERLLRDDPVREDTYRTLMRLHDGQGDRARAVRIFHLCSTTLERELGVEPSDATRLTYEALLAGDTDSTATTHAGRPPLVGRTPERARLAAAWRSADAGTARFVLVSGEPGVGKSRLVEEFRAWCARRGATAADARCYPAEGTLAYGPVVDWLRSAALRPRLLRLDRARLTEIARLLPELLVEMPELDRPDALPEDDQRQRLFDAVSTAVLTPGGPVLLVVDDLQHAGRETCQLLHYLLRVAPDARVLVAATVRREELDVHHPVHDLVAGLRNRDRLDEIELVALTRRETAHLAERLTGRSFAEPEVQRLFDETEGNPLYVVEALRAGWVPGRPLTPRVQSVIEDRLAQLSGPARELVGVAATIGREFSTDVLASVTGSDEDALVGGLDELWRRGLIREQGLGRYGAGYDFSHDKIRQVAYLDVTPARRRRLHRLVAAALEQANADAPGPFSAQIAAHHEHAGALEQAVTWYGRAAEAAQVLHADDVAVRLLERALELLVTLPGSAARDAMELELCTALVGPLTPLHGYASTTLSATQQRALRLADGLGVEAAAPLLRSLAMRALTRTDFAGATRYGQLLWAAGERGDDDVLVVEGAYVLGIASFWQADLAPARRAFELAVERYRPSDRTVHLLRYAQDPKVVCLSRLGNTLWFLGLPDAAVEARTAAFDWADEIDHPFSRSVAVLFGAVLALDMGDEHSLRQYTAELQRFGNDVLHRDVAAAFRGCVDVLDGAVEEGLAAIRDAVRRTRESPTAPGQHALISRVLLAACAASGDRAATLAAADRLIQEGGPARLWAATARRVRAELDHRG